MMKFTKKFNVCIVRKKNKLYFKGDDSKKTKGNRILFAYGK